MGKDKEKHGNRNNSRYNDRRRISNDNRDEEPEWFSGGPVSQHETIELRGFDDAECEKMGRKKHSTTQKKKTKERVVNKNPDIHQAEPKDKQEVNLKNSQDVSNASKAARSPAFENDIGGGGDTQDKPKNNVNNLNNNNSNNHNNNTSENAFNFDDILKCDTIAGLLPVSLKLYFRKLIYVQLIFLEWRER